jgi:hypothetical protein
MSEQPNLPAMRPLDEVLYAHRISVLYSDALDIDKIKEYYDLKNTHKEGERSKLFIVIDAHIRDGNIKVLDEILKITDYDWTVLRIILEYSHRTNKICLQDFIRYLKLYIDCPIKDCFHVYAHNNEDIYNFGKELFKYNSSFDKTVGDIYTIKSYEDNINEIHTPLEHLLKTINMFLQLDVKFAGNRK